ncbi:DUF1559 domain-containing protein [Fuerstiella marisgermanici]|uniref:DUF1559 domain-containing protein n=1 Tax=Fuerstiella marisgermanici TaxID=1891926 RepID=A0A1P8WD21_9PLAN|nr:DUF1559 domain-containing protein [Fuerstiella marisgermanici]APZ91950.1 hypothetical protein Fuma_01551 [Fuerstiella marisgermanici]
MYEFPPDQTNWWPLLLFLFAITIAVSIAIFRAGWAVLWEFTFAVVTGVFLIIVVMTLSPVGAIRIDNFTFAFLLIALPSSVCLHIRAVYRERGYGKGVVVGAIGGWATLLVTIVGLTIATNEGAHEASRRTQCKNNLKQIALGFHNYHDAHKHFPAAAGGDPPISWRVLLLSQIHDEAHLEDKYDQHATWDSDVNRPIQKEECQTFICPSRPDSVDPQGRFLTSYLAPTGPGTAFNGPDGIPISAIKDGSSNSLMVLEACGSNVIWTEPRDQPVSTATMDINGPGPQPGRSDSLASSYHSDGAQVALADGSVRFVSESTDARVLRALLSIDGGEELSDW